MVFMIASQNKTNRTRSDSAAGFSLIEVAIGLMVIGLLMGPIIHTYNLYIKSRQISQSQAVVDVVNSALLKYYEKFGFYPAPAHPNLAETAANFGSPATAGAGWPACTAASTVVCETTTGTFGGAAVLIGDVPFAELGIPFKSTLDGYGSKLTYAVTRSLTQNSPPLAPFDDNAGAIEILNTAGVSIYDTPPDNRAHFIVVSHGEDANGAFTLSGVRRSACGATTGIDAENCDNDGVFVNYYDTVAGKKVRAYADNANHFDDFTAEVNTTAYGLWSYIPNSGMRIQATNLGNIYIGTCADVPCIPKSKIDVNGSIKAQEVKTSRICNVDDNNCITTHSTTLSPRYSPDTTAPVDEVGWFSPEMLTGAPEDEEDVTAHAASGNSADATTEGYVGAGIRCYDNKGLRGIRNFDEVCGYTGSVGSPTSTPYLPDSLTVIGAPCPSGEYAYKVTINTTSANSLTIACKAATP